MNKKLTQKLYSDFPKIFRQHSLSITETALCWDFQCSSGWEFLIRRLCEQLQWDIDHNKQPQIEATTVKEKFGSLYFYVSGSNEKQEAMITFAEYLSNFICEECGSLHNVKKTKGYILTLCWWCRIKRWWRQ